MELRVKEICKEQGITMEQLATEKLGITRIGLTKAINGNPTLETLEKIAVALGINFTELFESSHNTTAGIVCPHCGKSITIKAE